MHTRKTHSEHIFKYAPVFAICLAALLFFSSPSEAKIPNGKVAGFTHNDSPVGLQGLICNVEYQGDDGILYSMEYRYWGLNNSGGVSIRRLIEWREGKKDQKDIEILSQNVNAMGVFSIDVAPGQSLMLEIDRFNRLLVTEHPNLPTS